MPKNPSAKHQALLKPFLSQKGFSALPMFLAGLGLLTIMGMTGFFTYPKSPADTSTIYTATNNPTSQKSNLQLIDLTFEEPTAVPTIPTVVPTNGPTDVPLPTNTPGPTLPPQPTATPGPTLPPQPTNPPPTATPAPVE